jgi:hypothetical protein
VVNKQTRSVKPESKFVQIAGRWRFEATIAVYLGPDERNQPYGLCLSPNRFRSGDLSALATIKNPASAARVVVGYNAGTGAYYSVGIGGYGYAYVIDEFAAGRGWRAVRATGACSQIRTEKAQLLEVSVGGQRVSVSVEGVRVLEDAVPFPLQGDQAGLFAWGEQEVTFKDFTIRGDKPRVFVVMQFGEPYDFLYRDVILPVTRKLEFEAFRADDVFRPGIILQDIIRGIIECDVVIADITPVNANVFYELGYAHAMEKPTILLANRSVEKLPFDVSGYRVVYYSDTIHGKGDITSALEKHLESIRRGAGVA